MDYLPGPPKNWQKKKKVFTSGLPKATGHKLLPKKHWVTKKIWQKNNIL